jgi:beta-N-acetylhexosaminidase
MSLGPLMVGIAGPRLAQEEREMLRHPLIGGVILFARNYAEPAQLQDLVASIHAVKDSPLLVAVDQEGGRVQRFRDGFVSLPPMRQLGRIHDQDPKKAKSYAQLIGWLMAAELRAVGVDLSFAPVLDLDCGTSEVIGDRAFHRDPETVAELGHAFMVGMDLAGMRAVGKHFPGHGTAAADSHVAMVTDNRGYEDIAVEDLVPFERMIHYGLAALMAAHVVYPRVDVKPAGFSRLWLQAVLRERLGFQGAIFSDDLGMAGAGMAGDMGERATAALEAGCDMILLCNELAMIPVLLERLDGYRNPASQLRLARLHGRGKLDRVHVRMESSWQDALHAVAECDRPDTPDLV